MSDTAVPEERERRRRKFAFALFGACAVGVVVAAVSDGGSPPEDPGGAQVLGDQVAQAPAIEAACDVDGVDVAWDVGYTAAAPAGYRVVSAQVTNVSATCAGALVTVRVRDGETVLASGTVAASGPTVPVTFATPPSAQLVNAVDVEIAGGEVPVPPECEAITFATYGVLTNAADTHTATNGNDLRYGLDGNDLIFGANQRDCLVGQNGDDTLRGENHDDVLLGESGNDTLEGGNHSDLLVGGEGNDVLDGGNQNDVLRGGPGNDTLRGGNGNDRCEGGGGTDTFVSCEVVV